MAQEKQLLLTINLVNALAVLNGKDRIRITANLDEKSDLWTGAIWFDRESPEEPVAIFNWHKPTFPSEEATRAALQNLIDRIHASKTRLRKEMQEFIDAIQGHVDGATNKPTSFEQAMTKTISLSFTVIVASDQS